MRLHLGRFIIIILSIFVVGGCTIYQKPRPIHDVPFQARSQSKIDGEVRVTVAVLSAEESRRLFGVNLAGENIQPVWVRVQNADTVPYWLMSSGMDPDYFSPLEAAYAFHATIGSSVNPKIDDHFRVMNFRNPIAQGTSVSGFVLTNRDEGTKVVDIDLVGPGSVKFVCVPDPLPSRNKAIGMFIEWAKSHSQYMGERPVEAEFRFLMETWPCNQ